MGEDQGRRPGPSACRKPFNLHLDPFQVKARLRDRDISYQQIADRAGLSARSVSLVCDVLAGRKRSIYVERAVADLLAERAPINLGW